MIPGERAAATERTAGTERTTATKRTIAKERVDHRGGTGRTSDYPAAPAGTAPPARSAAGDRPSPLRRTQPIRVLVVDDSAIVRRLISDALSSTEDIEVVGVAANGRIALSKIPHLRPDVITLDIEMPELDGLETLAIIRREHPWVSVIMFSTLTDRAAAATLDALALGARDYVTKPSGAGSMNAAVQVARAELVPRIRSLCARSAPRQGGSPPTLSARRHQPAGDRGGRVDVVAIAVSTGGPNALAALLPALPAGLAVPVLIVQHMPETFTRLLAGRLNSSSPLDVQEASAGAVLAPGQVRLAPGGHHMLVRRGPAGVVLKITDDPPENSCRPAADPLFRSVASVYGSHVLAVVLTGMGSDGLRGGEVIVRAGGQLVAQDEASSVVWGMPGEVVRAGLAHAVLPIDRIAAEITRRAALGRTPAARKTTESP